MQETENDASKDEDILEEARDRFERIQSDDAENRKNYKADTLFVYSPGQQWPDDVRATRSQWKELCLEFNQLKQFVAQVVNDQRQNRPGIRYFPASGEASEDVAEIMQGMVRAVEYESNAEAVYDNAFQSAVVGGRGAWRVCSEYADNDGFNQRLCIKPIKDMLSVWADLNYEQPDGSDRSFVFVTESFTKDEFTKKWPKANPVSWDTLEACWSGSEESIVVADYYRRVCKKRTMVLMSDGAKGYKDEMPTPPEGVTIVREREVDDYQVEWYTIAGGQQILETYEWPGQYIPVIIIPGEDMVIDGKRVYQGLTRHARDAQSMLNFGMTQQAIHLSLTPRAPWVVAEGQIEGYENIWRDANQKNYSVLPYKPTTIDGNLAPPPQRTMPSMPDAGWANWCQMMIGMIKSTIGMYENSLGQKANEQSGRAIIAREKQGDTATFNFADNLARGIALTGRIFLEAAPVFYDTEQIVQTIGIDDSRRQVRINQPVIDGESGALSAIKQNDLSKGKYAVVSESGPSFATKRQETADKLEAMVSAHPPLMEIAGDLIVKAQDIPDADVIAERLELMLPPQILQAKKAKEQGQKPPDPQIMAEMQQKDQQLEQAVQTMDAMHAEIEKLKSGAEEKVRAAQIDADVDIQKARIAAANDLQKASLICETDLAKARIKAETDILIAGMTTPPELSASGTTVPAQESNKPDEPEESYVPA